MIAFKRSHLAAAAAVLVFALPFAPVPDFWITQLNYIGLFSLVVLGLVLLGWWLDGWMRALLPVANVAEPHASGRASRTGEQQRRRYANVTMLAGLDLIAIAVAISAKQPVARGRLSAEDDWWASIVLAVSTARASMVVVGIAAAIIWVSSPEQRAI